MSVEIQCLDHGFVRLIDHIGSDTRIVDAARVSYQHGTKAVQSDRHLIRYLLRNLHTTPFEKVVFEFHIKLPVFVARQWMRHRTGSFNEVSARYSVMKDEFYTPSLLREQSSNNKQGSSENIIAHIPTDSSDSSVVSPHVYLEETYHLAYARYQQLLDAGVARELARCVLPVALYTEFYWTVNLWNLMHFLKLRLDSHAQLEIRVFAEAIYKIISEHCNLQFTLEAFKDYILDDPKLTKFELQIIRDGIRELTDNKSLQEVKQVFERLLDKHPDMSKREKQESKLFKLLQLDQSNDTEIQPSLQEKSATDN